MKQHRSPGLKMNFGQLSDLSLDELTSRLGTVSAEIDEHGVRQLAELLETRAGDTYTRYEIPKLISRRLLQAGEPGVRALAAVLPRAPGAIYPDSILQALWFAAHGQLPPTLLTHEEDLPPVLNRPIPPNQGSSFSIDSRSGSRGHRISGSF
jgi:hypothetical protein